MQVPFRLPSRALVLVSLILLTPAAAFAQLTKAGVVTTLHGTATVSRASLTQPQPLKFKDDVFVQDRVVTGDDSIARILLGGKAVVTIRERSSLTITEAPGVSTVDIGVGRTAIAVTKERMKPGETIEIRTPNALAGIRGTIVVVEVDQLNAQVGTNAAAYTTRFTVITGEVLVRQLQGGQPFGNGVTLRSNEQAQFTGLTPPSTRSLTRSEADKLSNSFRAPKSGPTAAAIAPIVSQSQALAVDAMHGRHQGPSSEETRALRNSIRTSINPGFYDRRSDEAVQEATRTQSGRDALQDAQSSAQVMNTLSPTERQQLNVLLQQLRLNNSGPGSLNSGSGTSGSGSSAPGSSGSSGYSGSGGSVTITLPSGVQVILQNGKLKGSNSGPSGH